ncbi:hypothetical protein D1007_58052 [Hordeum vulgare]|nr:hypothetical protein D1007_58052 [Hordeum vulgare]
MLAHTFAKVCATRLSPVADRIAHPLQSAFLKGRKIHDGILALHEIVHEVASKGLKGVFLKLDFQKAYDRLDWSFLRLHRIADNLNCKLAAFPISYLVMPLAESRILVSGFDPLVGRVASRAEPWCGRFTSKGSKSSLISSNLASLPMYMMGMYLLPEGVHNAFDKELARFFCMPKDRGGLGIPASRRMNVALMLRWVWRIVQGDGGLWLQLIEAKYLRGRPLLACSLENGSQLWKSIQSIKHEIRLGLRVSVGNGFGTQFWLDPWLEGEPLRFRFPRLFAICSDPAVLVYASVLEDGWHVDFRRPLGSAEVQDWELLLAVVPLPVSALLRDRLPSGTEVLKRHGPGNDICPLCHVSETGSHILFSCVAAQALWCFVHEALGLDWEAYDLVDFLQVRATQVGRKRRLFWLVFAAMMWTLWTTHDKIVIEKVFQRRASDSFFKFLAFLQHWHPLVGPRYRDWLQRYLDVLMVTARWLSSTSLAT